ncbi:M4A15 protein, partial [Calcarius ornatus]|nr:M4A15 protein [Calcarius ornatus]
MAATTVTDAGSVRIITEVIPATDPRAAQLASGSQAPARTSFQTQGFRRAHPKVLGTIHIFTGIVHICFGIILTVSEHRNPSLPVASGILFWLGILLLVSGSLLVESERRDSPVLVRSRLGGTRCPPIPHVPSSSCWDPSTAWIHPKGSTGQFPPQEAFFTLPFSSSWQMLSNGLDSILVLLGLLEFCVAVAVLAFGYDTVRQHTYTQLVREAGI